MNSLKMKYQKIDLLILKKWRKKDYNTSILNLFDLSGSKPSTR